jgi:septal ring factor EnvC (AmiA/AmiB activator)
MIKLFGLTTVAALEAAQKQRDDWKLFYQEASETIAQLAQSDKECSKDKAELQQKLETVESAYRASLATNAELEQSLQHLTDENEAITVKLEATTTKIEELTQELKDCRTLVKTLEDANKEQADKLGKQIETIDKALEEAAQQGLLYNQATVEITQLKLVNNRNKIAIDNFILEVTN